MILSMLCECYKNALKLRVHNDTINLIAIISHESLRMPSFFKLSF